MTRSAPSAALGVLTLAFALALALGREQRAVLVGELDHRLGVTRAGSAVAVLNGFHRSAGLREGVPERGIGNDLLRGLLQQGEALGMLLDHFGMDRPGARRRKLGQLGAEDLVDRR